MKKRYVSLIILFFVLTLVGCSESEDISKESFTYLPKKQAIEQFVKHEGLNITDLLKLELRDGINLILIRAANKQIYFVGQLHESQGNYAINRITPGWDVSELSGNWSIPIHIKEKDYTLSVHPANKAEDHFVIDDYGIAVDVLQENDNKEDESLLQAYEVWYQK
ncbi:hypothetical protein J2Z32_000924 [Paenibacillus turicensis]|uniref:Lipoprotein n=1 Tax=Paenibacillus turicensis TaxID=160487 RepID=A0ABS4FP08_9BACL|nr:hypothetical protein [Paenibacillus turicensis]MBP1904307.1 hypothetical protein [Paenibacillus turicensis]